MPSEFKQMYEVGAGVWIKVGKEQTQLIPHYEKWFGLKNANPDMADAQASFDGVEGYLPHLPAFAALDDAWVCLHLLAERDDRPVVLVSNASSKSERHTHPLLADSLAGWFLRLQSFGFDIEAACADAKERIASPQAGDYDPSAEVRWNQERLQADRMADSIAAVDRALAKIDSMTDEAGRVLDPEVVEYMQEDVIHSTDTPYVVVAEPKSYDRLAEYMQQRFGVVLPKDLAHLLSRVGGVAVHRKPDAGFWPDGSWLRTSDIVNEAEALRENVTHDDRELPTIPLAIAYPGGPNLAIWVDKYGPPYRVVTYDHETSSDIWFRVVAPNVGEAFEAYVDENFDILSTTHRRRGLINAVYSDAPQEVVAPEPEPTEERGPTPEEKLEITPLDFSDDELIVLWVNFAEGAEESLNRLEGWTKPLGRVGVEWHQERRAPRQRLMRAGLAAAIARPALADRIDRYMTRRFEYPMEGLEEGLTPLDR